MSEVHTLITGYRPQLHDGMRQTWQTLISESVESYLTLGFPKGTLVINDLGPAPILSNHLQEEFRIVTPRSAPQGALATACLGIGDVSDQDVLLLGAGDTKVFDEFSQVANEFVRGSEAALVTVFENPDPERNWSYAHLDHDSSPLMFTESIRPTNLATTGHFFFRSREVFLGAARWCFKNHAMYAGTYFSSAALNHLIATGEEVAVRKVSREAFDKRYLD